ncbi:hypothetical protein [Streptosporangium roseum]|uniref:Uncharacterized protein n=1 Tax=Streptosporangium roseum (strain ATCC 12428 / DSM 43021 / JCM 3005 / KCTC 9067 / NCIMB 10171 / NRRL 2505 / NI 9100) TaxID=479432 RepID=D2BBG3_STRRD|nr:hypothetical protein [Streptosporangium roseum]ACZ84186.1 hypothetical protein Sros_1188 [Streptosporangium roseum DSM 43021]
MDTATLAAGAEHDEEVPESRPRSRLLAVLPGTAAAAVTVCTLTAYGTPPSAIGLFALYVAFGLTLPGTLLWRALARLPSPPAVDLAAGTALGYALEVLLYLAARAVGHPGLILLGPPAVIAVFLAHPRLRRHWRTATERRIPVRAAAAMAAVFCFLVVSSGLTFFGGHGLRWPENGNPYVDMPFHLGLVGELRHHLPPTTPHVLGEPLSYHWFVYADMAATSWATGIEAQTLLYRLAVLPMIAISVVLVPAVAFMITGTWRAGVLGLLITCFAGPLDPYPWTVADFPGGPSNISLAWLSPTQTFGAALFAAFTLPVVALLGRRAPGRSIFVPVAVLLVALAGAKATYLPLLAAGLCLLAAVEWTRSRRLDRTLVALGLLTLVTLAFAQLVLFGGASQGLRVSPFSTAVRFVMWSVPGSGSGDLQIAPALLSLVFLLAWAALWAGAFGRRAAPGSGPDRALTLFLGIGLGGVGAVTVFGHPGMSQMYFLTAARPYLSIAAAAGVLAALAAVPRRSRVRLVCACGAAGGAVALLVAAVRPESPPGLAELGGLGSVAVLVLPVIVPCAVAGAAICLLWRLRWRWAGVLLLLAGFSAPTVVQSVVAGLTYRVPVQTTEIPAEGVAVARWLRDHSGPDDVVATNAHCRFAVSDSCDNRHFWISGYTERRVLVEGWGYTARTLASLTDVDREPMGAVPFWDAELLAANDAVFTAPTARAVDLLARRYGVRWLMVDRRRPLTAPDLGQFARLRYARGSFAVYSTLS